MTRRAAKPNGWVDPAKIKGVMGPKGSIHKAGKLKPGPISKAKFVSMAKGSGPNAKKAKLTLLLNKNKKGWG